jgi:hypothetical protein
VAESFGLGGFWYLIFDQPRFMGVAEVVKVHACDDWWDVAAVAVGDGSPGAAVEAGAA